MIIQISDDESIILKSLIFGNIQKGKRDIDMRELFIRLEHGHLFIMFNAGGALKVKGFENKAGRTLKECRGISIKRKPAEFGGICIDLNL